MLICSSGCVANKGWALRSVQDQTIIFYVDQIGGEVDKDILRKNLVYRFEKNGIYKSYFESGVFFEAGDYSYVKLGPNKGRLILTYTMKGETYIYELVMKYQTSTEGSWTGFSAKNPDIKGKEFGTFLHLKKKQQ